MAGVIDIRDRLARGLQEAFNIPAPDARRFAQGFANELAAEFGGLPVYVRRKTMTDAEIVGLFDGANHDEVCRTAGISRRTLLSKLRKHRRRGAGGHQSEHGPKPSRPPGAR